MNYQGDYYIGLDCGTESVGFAVTDTEYNVLKFNGKSMWGAHLFDEAKTAADRRVHRAARRRYERKKERIRLVQGLFADEIAKVDPLFFQRLNDSSYFPEDKTINQPNSLFDDADFKDKDYFKLYPTIFHLRDALRRGEAKKDPRLLYLAIHHIMKNRGHFLFTASSDLKAVMDPKPLLDDISDASEAAFDGKRISFIDCDAVKEALLEKKRSVKKEALKALISFEDGAVCRLFADMLAGSKVKLDKLFGNDGYTDLPAVEFSKSAFEETDLPTLEDSLSDDEYRLIVLFKAVYDWGLLAGVMEGSSFISEAKVRQYDSNATDLALLKKAVKLHAPDGYEDFFHKDGVGSFSSYIGAIHDNGRKTSVRRTSTDEFYKKVKKLIGEDPTDEASRTILERIGDRTFLSLLISFRNSVIPYQVHKAEMDAIIEASAKDFPFLMEKGPDGLSVKEKLDKIIMFRIPYYVGPLGRNDRMVSGWAVRKADGKVLPWNFNDMIDEDASAEGFIRAMTNKCTYLPGEDVLPKNSLLYSRFMVLNELNNVRVNGVRLTVEQKQTVYNGLFRKKKKVTQNQLQKFMVSEGWYRKDELSEISGIDGDFKASLSSYIDFSRYLESKKLRYSDVEEIIKWLTLFSEGGGIAERKIKAAFSDRLSPDEIKAISRLKYTGWGRLSERFLSGIESIDRSTGEMRSIITMMWETQHNLMELLSSDFDFLGQVGEHEAIDKLDYSVVDALAVSPSVKRQIWQTLKIVDEIERIMKHPPKKVFLEVARGGGEKGKRTISRKQDLLSKLKNSKEPLDASEKDILSELDSCGDNDVSCRDKLYLYFTQLGKCMYSGKPVDLEDIGNTEVYDVDHIYPYSRSNDDSLSNKVLVLKVENSRKSDAYPIDDSIRTKMMPFWQHLSRLGLISPEKFRRLTRCTPLTEEDDKGFVARQLVETSQTAKATAEILKRYFHDESKVVYSKAGNVSDFRDVFKFVKVRSLNCLHHAKDAYLNIVVGNVFDTKYTSDFIRNRKDRDIAYNLSKPYEVNVPGAWKYGSNGTIATVRKQMAKNDVLYTKQCIEVGGAFFDLMPVAAGSKNGALPLKGSDPVLRRKLEESLDHAAVMDGWTGRYGGYNNASTAYFALVRHKGKKGSTVSFIPISILDSKKIVSDDDLVEVCRNKLHLVNPEVVRRRVLKNTMISIDGCLFCITGKASGGSLITMESAVPLILDDESSRLVKKIDKYLAARKANKDLKVDPVHDGISAESNLRLYDEFARKSQLAMFLKRPSCQTQLIVEGRDRFLSLSLEDQCSVISNLVLYFGMGGGKADLSLLGGSKNAGMLVHNSSFQSSGKKLKILDRSVTGLFETVEAIKI